MNRKAFRIVIVLAAVSIAGILVVQLFWVSRAFDLRHKQFSHNVNIALLNAVTSLCELNGNEIPVDPVEQLATNYFIVNLNNKISPTTLESVLRSEFSKREVVSDFEYGIFDCANEEMVYGDYVALEGKETKVPHVEFPALQKDAYYFGVYFPNKSADIAGQMGIWIFSSGILLVVVVFFSYTLLVIFRQKQLSEVQTDFINNMTHEFKTPISTIAISSNVLRQPAIVEQPDKIRNYAHIIHLEANRLQNQVDRVLQIASIGEREIALNKEPVDINGLIQGVVEQMRLTVEEKGARIGFSEQASDATLEIDRLHFTNIVYNLLDNALKYTQADPVIELKTYSDSQALNIEVIDNGLGMTKEQVAMVFKKFYRVPTGNRHDVKGFGLGLYYVKLIVEAHKGKIAVASTPGKGSVFTITLPRS